MEEHSIISQYSIRKEIDIISYYNSQRLPTLSYIWIGKLLKSIFEEKNKKELLSGYFNSGIEVTKKPFSVFYISFAFKDAKDFIRVEDILNSLIADIFYFINHCSDKDLQTLKNTQISDTEIFALYENFYLLHNFEISEKSLKEKRL